MIRDKRALCFGMSRALLAASIALACSDHPTRGGMALTTFAANLDPPVAVGDEAYECRLFDASELKGAAVHELRWTPPSGALRLHHAMMFVTPEAGPPGPWP